MCVCICFAHHGFFFISPRRRRGPQSSRTGIFCGMMRPHLDFRMATSRSASRQTAWFHLLGLRMSGVRTLLARRSRGARAAGAAPAQVSSAACAPRAPLVHRSGAVARQAMNVLRHCLSESAEGDSCRGASQSARAPRSPCGSRVWAHARILWVVAAPPGRVGPRILTIAHGRHHGRNRQPQPSVSVEQCLRSSAGAPHIGGRWAA